MSAAHVEVPPHAREAWERLTQEKGRHPTTREFAVLGGGNTRRHVWYKALVSEARAAALSEPEAVAEGQAPFDAAQQARAAWAAHLDALRAVRMACATTVDATLGVLSAIRDACATRVIGEAALTAVKAAQAALDAASTADTTLPSAGAGVD